jgi:hypothetical protein
MSLYTRPSLWAILGGVLLLVLVGFRPSGLPFQPEARFSDAVVTHWGSARLLRESVLQGEYPLWQDTILAGGPFAANPLNKTAYPLQWMLVLLPPLTHLNLMIFLHALIAGLGMWFWLRVTDASTVGSATGALAYVAAPRLIGHLGAGHLDIFYAMAWFPWMLLLIYTGPLTKNPLRHTALLGLVGAMLVLADTRVALFGVMLGGSYAIWRVIVAREWRYVVRLVAAVVLSLPLLAALVFPLWSWRGYLSRGTLTVADASVFSIDWLGFVGLFIPAHVGSAETMVYLGLPVLVLGCIGWVRRPLGERLLWGWVILLAIIWSVGSNGFLWQQLAQFDLIRWFRVPGRAWLMAVVTSAYLVGHGIDVIRRMADSVYTTRLDNLQVSGLFWPRLAAVGFAGMLGVCGTSLLLLQVGEIPQSAGIMLLVNAVGLGGGLLLALLGRTRGSWVAIGIALLLYADLAVTGIHQVEWRGPEAWIEPHMPLATRLEELSPDRIYSPNFALEQHMAHLAGFKLFYGVDPFQLTGILRAIEAGSGVPVESYSVVLPPLEVDENSERDDPLALANRDAVPDLVELARWDVSHIVATYPYDIGGLTFVDRVGDTYIYRNQVYDDLSIDDLPSQFVDLLPSASEIDRLNRRTMVSAWVSSVGFVAVFLALGIDVLRGRRTGA